MTATIRTRLAAVAAAVLLLVGACDDWAVRPADPARGPYPQPNRLT